MQVLNSYQDSKLIPEPCKNHETKTSPSLQKNSKAETTQVPAGKSNDLNKQERMQSINCCQDSDKKGKVSADNNIQTSLKKKDVMNNDNNDNNDFTFSCSQPDSSVTADMLFQNGQIRPVYHADNTDNMDKKKVVVEERDSGSAGKEPAGPYCTWSPEQGKKAGSTGNSKRWRLKDIVMRSRSEGDKRKSGETKGKKEKEGDKYLPQVGFITNVNGPSSNSSKVTKPI